MVLQMFNMRTACNAAHMKSVLWLLLNMLQHVLGNSLQLNSRAKQVVNKETSPHWRLLPKAVFSNLYKTRPKLKNLLTIPIHATPKQIQNDPTTNLKC